MPQQNKIYIPTFISSVNYQPARVLPHVYFYNGTKSTNSYYIQGYNSPSTSSVVASEFTEFPYFDNYSGNTPTSSSLSLLFNNEPAVYGDTPTGSLYSTYWSRYVDLLYSPKTRVMNCSAIIPLANYFDLELNDIVQFRGNYWHLRAINNYSLKTGECDLQLLGPILNDIITSINPELSCDFDYDIAGGTFTTTTSTTTTSTTTTTTTIPPRATGSLSVSQSIFSLIDIAFTSSYNGSGTTIYDISGRGNNATIETLGNWNYNSSALGNPVLQLNTGSTTGVIFPNFSSGEYTLVAAWYGANRVPNSTGGNTAIFMDQDQDPGNNQYGMAYTSSYVGAVVATMDSANPVGPVSGAADNRWHVSQVSFNDATNTGNYCIDGVTGSYSSTETVGSNIVFRVFGEDLRNGKYGSGSMFQVAAVYSGSLSTTQMLENYNSIVRRYGITSTTTTTTTTAAPTTTTTSTTTTIAPTGCIYYSFYNAGFIQRTYSFTDCADCIGPKLGIVPAGQIRYACVVSGSLYNTTGLVVTNLGPCSGSCP